MDWIDFVITGEETKFDLVLPTFTVTMQQFQGNFKENLTKYSEKPLTSFAQLEPSKSSSGPPPPGAGGGGGGGPPFPPPPGGPRSPPTPGVPSRGAGGSPGGGGGAAAALVSPPTSLGARPLAAATARLPRAPLPPLSPLSLPTPGAGPRAPRHPPAATPTPTPTPPAAPPAAAAVPPAAAAVPPLPRSAAAATAAPPAATAPPLPSSAAGSTNLPTIVPDTLKNLITWIKTESKDVTETDQDKILKKRTDKDNSVKYIFLQGAENIGTKKDKFDYAKTLEVLDEYQMIKNTGGRGNDCLIISFLMSVSLEYRKLDYDQKYSIASKFRRITLPTLIMAKKPFLRLNEERVSEVLKDLKSTAMLKDDQIGILVNLYNINILSLESYKEQRFGREIHKDYPKAHRIVPDRDISGSANEFGLEIPGIIIINRGNFHYESVEKEPDQYIFLKDELNVLYKSVMQHNKYFKLLKYSLPKNIQDNKYCIKNDPPFVRVDDCKVGAHGYETQTLDKYIGEHNIGKKVVILNGRRYLKAYRSEKMKYAVDNPLTRVGLYEQRMQDFFTNKSGSRAIANARRPTNQAEWTRWGNEPSIGINLTTGIDGALTYGLQSLEEGNPPLFSLKTFYIDIDETKNVLSIRKRCTWAQITCDQTANTTYDLIVHRDMDNEEINILDKGRDKVKKITSTTYQVIDDGNGGETNEEVDETIIMDTI